MTPRRIQLSRKKGFKLPTNTVVVSRPTKWGNPYRIGSPFGVSTPAGVVALFEKSLNGFAEEVIRRELRGKNLACWCKLGTPCHADVLLKIANS